MYIQTLIICDKKFNFNIDLYIIFYRKKVLKDHKVEVKDVIVLLDREQGAVENISKTGVNVHRLLLNHICLNLFIMIFLFLS